MTDRNYVSPEQKEYNEEAALRKVLSIIGEVMDSIKPGSKSALVQHIQSELDKGGHDITYSESLEMYCRLFKRE